MAGQAAVTVRNKQWNVSVATSPWELTKGLGGLASIPSGTGMLFDLGYPQTIQVTTVPMLFPLDIAFLSDTLVITEVYRNVQPGYLVTSTLPARYFLEVNAGELEGIDTGDKATVEITTPAQAEIPDWVSTFIALIGFAVFAFLIASVMKDFIEGILEEPKKVPKLLPQTEARFRPREIVRYKGERVRVLEHIGDRVSIWIPSRQEQVWVKSGRLEKVEPEKRQQDEELAYRILKGLSGKEGDYRAFVKFPRDKSAFVTIGAIVGGHYSWNPAGFTVWVDAYERNPEWPPDYILAIKELRRPRSFEATEEGVEQALDYVEKEFSTFTETMGVSKSIPLYVAYELGILKKEAAPEWLPGVVVMPKIPEEARKDALFVEYIHDMVRLGEKVTDEEARVMWQAWQKRELSKLPHTELLQKQTGKPGLTGQAISTNKALNNAGEVMKYRVEENKPYGTWAIVELWTTGTVRSPFKTREEAIKREEEIGKYYGWKLKRVEFTPQEISLLDPQRFPKQTEALVKLRGYDMIEVHDDGDLTVRSRGKLYVVTTEGRIFEQQHLPQTHQVKPRLIPVEKPKAGKTDLEFLPDSPEFLAYTIEDIGYREKIDTAFQQAIARAKGAK